MKRTTGALLSAAVLSMFTLAYLFGAFSPPATLPCSVKMVGEYALGGVTGRLDHLSLDPTSDRLFVAALGNNSVEVLNLTSGEIVKTIGGLNEPQGVLYASGFDLLYVSNGGDGKVGVYDGQSYALKKSVSFPSDADNIRLDAASGQVYIGYGVGGIATADIATGQVVGDIGLAGHPEGFQVAAGGRVFVNVPSSGYVAVADAGSGAVLSRWPIANASGNFALAIDEKDSRLFIATRTPAQLIVLDAKTGGQVARVGISQDPDDVYYDAARGCVYISTGQGFLSVVRQLGPDKYTLVASVPTSPGARTSLFSPDSNQLFVAAPAGSLGARILVYEVSPA